jgi:hypothetical protein
MGAGPSSQRSCSPRAYAIAWQQRPCVCSTRSQHEPTQASMYTDAQTGPATTDHEVLLCTEYGKGGKAIRCKQPITGPTVGHAACTVGHVVPSEVADGRRQDRMKYYEGPSAFRPPWRPSGSGPLLRCVT